MTTNPVSPSDPVKCIRKTRRLNTAGPLAFGKDSVLVVVREVVTVPVREDLDVDLQAGVITREHLLVIDAEFSSKQFCGRRTIELHLTREQVRTFIEAQIALSGCSVPSRRMHVRSTSFEIQALPALAIGYNHESVPGESSCYIVVNEPGLGRAVLISPDAAHLDAIKTDLHGHY